MLASGSTQSTSAPTGQALRQTINNESLPTSTHWALGFISATPLHPSAAAAHQCHHIITMHALMVATWASAMLTDWQRSQASIQHACTATAWSGIPGHISTHQAGAPHGTPASAKPLLPHGSQLAHKLHASLRPALATRPGPLAISYAAPRPARAPRALACISHVACLSSLYSWQ